MVNSRLCETARPAGFKIWDRDLKKDNRDPKKTLETHQKRLRDFQIRPKFSTTYIFQGTILYRFSCCLWTEVCMIPAFLNSPSHLLVSVFQVIYFELPITRTFLDFPRRFELPGVDSGYFCTRWRGQKLLARPCFLEYREIFDVTNLSYYERGGECISLWRDVFSLGYEKNWTFCLRTARLPVLVK